MALAEVGSRHVVAVLVLAAVRASGQPCLPADLIEARTVRLQLAAEKARKEAEQKAAEEAASARRAEDDRADREAAAARVSQAQERQAADALSRYETEFSVAWACEPAVRSPGTLLGQVGCWLLVQPATQNFHTAWRADLATIWT